MKLTLIRSATLKLEYGGRCILIDPAFSAKLTGPSFAGKSKNPLIDLPMTKEAIVDGVDAMIVSHLHSDHFDKAAQAFIDKSLPVLCQPNEEESIRDMGFVDVRPIGERYRLGDVEIIRTYAKHGSGSVQEEMGEASGFVFNAPGEPVVYWPGDTVLCNEVRSVLANEKPAMIILHSAGAVWNGVKILFDEVETVEICEAVPDATVVAVHLDSYDHGTVSRASLRAYASSRGIDTSRLRIPDDGETLILE
ncbi:MAG TPA: MBL fold metallo-hydrolase [Bacillota bacterium]|nr:MBL fold metallo-hydrolase [Bacillota bacterium]